MSALADLPLIASGKVRELYDLGDRLLLVASDRISTFDAVHPTPIPDKGKVLTGLSVFWFEQLADVIPNHFISATEGVPDEVRGRALVVEKLDMLPVECVVRGYITGSGWKDYQATGHVSGLELPPGLQESEQLPDAALHAEHEGRGRPRRGDRLRADGRAAGRRPRARRAGARRVRRAVREGGRARALARRDPRRHEVRAGPRRERRADARRRGADARLLALLAGRRATRSAAGSRASTSSTCATGPPQTGWDKQPPAPEIPDDVVAATRAKYVEAYELITGEPFDAWLERTAP